MTTSTVRLNENEAKIIRDYSKLTNTPISTLMKNALLEKIEDELDYQAGIKALKESNGETISLDEL